MNKEEIIRDTVDWICRKHPFVDRQYISERLEYVFDCGKSIGKLEEITSQLTKLSK